MSVDTSAQLPAHPGAGPRWLCWALVSWALLAGFVAPLRAADRFYTELLSSGIRSFDRGDFTATLRDVRIASFGLLNEPDTLAQALTYLAMAQAASDDFDGFTNTAHRVVEIENHFGAFTRADLPADLRSRFTHELAARVSEGTLLDSPTFAPLVRQRSQQRFASLTAEQQRSELTRRLTDEPNSLDILNSLVALDLAAGRTIDALNWLDRIVGVDPSAMEVRCQRSNLAARVGDCRTALADRFHCSTPPSRIEPAVALAECMINQENWGTATALIGALAPALQADPKITKLSSRIRKKQRAAGPAEPSINSAQQAATTESPVAASRPAFTSTVERDAPKNSPSPSSYQGDLALLQQRLLDLSPSDDPAEVMILAQSISDRHPNSKAIQGLAGETAYRLSQWEAAVRFFNRAGRLSKKQPDLLFYLAVSLFETGQVEAARKPLQAALPRLQRTPFVESFIAKIDLQGDSAN